MNVYVIAGIILLGIAYQRCARIMAPYEGYLGTILMFGTFAAVYYIALPIENFFRDNARLPYGIPYTLAPTDVILLILMTIVAIVCFTIGLRFSGISYSLRTAGVANGTLPGGISFTLLIFLVLLFIFRNVAEAALSYTGNVELAYSNAIFSWIAFFAPILLAISAGHLLLKSFRWRYAVLAALILLVCFSLGVLTSSKDPMVIAFLGLLVPIHGKRDKRVKHFWVETVCLLLLTASLIPIYGQFRGYNRVTAEIVSPEVLGFTVGDQYGPMVSLQDIVQRREWELRFGLTYLDVIPLLIPKAVWQNRPLDLSESFAREIMQKWSGGEGCGFSMMAESIVNFGYCGCIIQYLLFGFLWGYCWKWVCRLSNPYYFNLIYRTAGLYLLVLAHRGPMAAVFKSLLQMTVPLILIYSLDVLLKRRKRDKYIPGKGRELSIPGHEYIKNHEHISAAFHQN